MRLKLATTAKFVYLHSLDMSSLRVACALVSASLTESWVPIKADDVARRI